MSAYEIYLQMQYLEQEIQELSEKIKFLDWEHPDVDFLMDLQWRSENELEQLMDLDVVEIY